MTAKRTATATVESTLAKVRRRIDRLSPEDAQREVVRVRLQILRNSVTLARGLDGPARGVLLEQIDELAACCGVRLFAREGGTL